MRVWITEIGGPLPVNVGLAPYKQQRSIPNKPIDYMACHLPVISSIQGELANSLNQYHAGFSYHADNARELVKAIEMLYNDQKLAT